MSTEHPDDLSVHGHKQFVPLAERPYAPEDHVETAEETVWQNVTGEDVILDVYVGIPTFLPKPSRTGKPLTWEQRTGKRRYIIRAKSKRAIPSEFDKAIQHHQCMETECSQRPFDCKDRTHRYMVVGGLAPQQLRMEGRQHRPVIAPGLDDLRAKEAAEKERTIQSLLDKQTNTQELDAAQAELTKLREEIAKRDQMLESLTTPGAKPAQAKTK